ncbi:MAG: hypothetical protein F6K39_45025 [Okeania sp. SIO3B3]|nr:hypothetical protein [Okeania sp. SIO3B3]
MPLGRGGCQLIIALTRRQKYKGRGQKAICLVLLATGRSKGLNPSQ